MNDYRTDEYSALRATIRERGTVRVITFLVTLIAWAALAIAFLISGPENVIGAVVCLLVLAAGFEAVFQIHLGVERVGRYLQVAYEERWAAVAPEAGAAAPPGWETTAMAYGKAYPSAGSDPLFTAIFLLATLANVLPVIRAWQAPALFAALVFAHLIFVVRIRVARKRAGRQRGEDLERFRQMLKT